MAQAIVSAIMTHRNRNASEAYREELAEAQEDLDWNDPTVSERRRMIAEAAFYRAEARNFEPGREIEDWLAAEAQIDSQSP